MATPETVSHIRWEEVELEGIGTVRVRELFLAEQTWAADGDMAKLIHACTYKGDDPFFASAEDAAQFPARLAMPLTNAILSASGLVDEDDEGKG